MALYHFNPAANAAMKCHAMVSCPYGDLDTAHYDSARECLDANLAGLPDSVVDSLALFNRLMDVNAAVEGLKAHCIKANLTTDPLDKAQGAFALLAYRLGSLSQAPTEEDVRAALSAALDTHSLLAKDVLTTYGRAGVTQTLLAPVEEARAAVASVTNDLMDSLASMK